MAFKKFAKALVTEPNSSFDRWVEELREQHGSNTPKDHVGRIAKTILRKCDPKQYLLSHITIVASVDTYAPRGVKTGRQLNRGMQIDVRYPDYRIKPECHDLINNNMDSFERSLLLSTYRTFVGASLYLEHIQVPELSKGFIVDAIARDLGKTVYVDILTATDRKHQVLVQDILSGQVSSASMGCVSLFTICSACGNVAVDDSQLCPDVLYSTKGSKFVDNDGIEHPISESIGHVTVPQSCQFIESSWVRNPAFVGAVRRNILNPDPVAIASKIADSGLVYELRRDTMEFDGMKKAASLRTADETQDAPPDAAPEEPSEDSADTEQVLESSPAPSSDPPSEPKKEPTDEIDELLQRAQEQILEVLVNKLDRKLAPQPEDVGVVTAVPDFEAESGGNDNLVHSTDFDRALVRKFPNNMTLVRWASRVHKIVQRHHNDSGKIREAGLAPRDLVLFSWIEDRLRGREFAPDLYKVAMALHSASFPTERSFFAACKIKLGRALSANDKKFFQWKARVGALAG